MAWTKKLPRLLKLKITQPIVIKAHARGFKIVDGGKRDLCNVWVEVNEAKAIANGPANAA